MTDAANNQGEGEQVSTDPVEAGADAGAQASTDAAASADAGTGDAPIRPEGLPDDLWDAASGVKVGDLWAVHRDLLAKDAERTAGVPAADQPYDLALPSDFEVPAGLAVEIKADDPLWADFQTIAREAGVTKDAFGKFVGAFAKYQIAAQEADVQAYVEAKTALGANADTRIKAAGDWLKANLNAKQADALGGALISADGVTALETLIRLKSGPVTATVSGQTTSEFEGLYGADRLAAIRAKQAS